MPHPKRRQSKSRRDKRRKNNNKVKLPQLSTCTVTGQIHIYHNAHWYQNKLYYKGHILID